MDKKGIYIKVLVEISRLLLGIVFMFSGVVKAIDPVGFSIKIGDYLTSFGLGSLNFLSEVAAFNLIAVEFMLGVCMFCGVYRKYTSLLTLLMMVFMTPLTLYLAIFNPVSDCGCFGDAIIISNWETFSKNVLLLIAAIYVYINNQRQTSFFTTNAYWFVTLYAYLACIAFSFYNYRHLPIKDFRPYKVGVNISELIEIPEGAPEDEYEFIFVYEKDGVTQEFSLEDYPKDDPSWTFVDTKMELITQGYRPPVEAFNIYNTLEDDVTYEILNNKDGVFLLIAPDLSKANDLKVDEIRTLYDYCLENGLQFYCVTGSGQDDIVRWEDNTGAEYPFLIADKTLLKTIIRSNPGLVLLKEGTILEKWHYNDIPKEDVLIETMLSYLDNEREVLKKDDRLLIANLLTFPLPLLLVWMYDYFCNRRRRKKINN